MLETWGRIVYRRRRWVLALTAVFVALAISYGSGVIDLLKAGGFDDPEGEAPRARQQIEQALGRDNADVIVLYESQRRTVDDPGYRAAVEEALADLPSDVVLGTTTFWSSQAPYLVSKDRHATYAVLQVAGETDDDLVKSFESIEEQLREPLPDITQQIGGEVAVFAEIGTTVEQDIRRAEIISLPIVLLLLVLVFGGLAAASLPLAVGGLAIVGALALLRVLTELTSVSVFALNIITMIGLGLAIDYALFIVSRFREEMAKTDSVEDALAATMATAGRTVIFSGVIVSLSVASLLMFPQMFLYSMGMGGSSVVALAVVGAMTALPALLAVLGPRVDSLRIPMPWRRSRSAAGSATGAWARIAHLVMRRPVGVIGLVVPLLLLLGSPFLNAEWGWVDHRVLPKQAESRMVTETLDRDFPDAQLTPVLAVVTFDRPVTDPGVRQELDAYVQRLRAVEGNEGVSVTGQAGNTVRVAVMDEASNTSPEARALVADVRDVAPPAGAEVLVGGQTARIVDMLGGLTEKLPWMGLFVLAVTFVLLFLAFGSVVLPLKAVVMNVLSLSASFGVLVWGFQEGHLAGLLDFTSMGYLNANNPILMLALLFGLSMDYEVFLLSRVREEYDRTGDNTGAVAAGLQRTGGIITSAALVLVVVIGAFSTSNIQFIKMIGIGMVVAIVLDATIVRVLLVPAAMRLMGRANWWAPGPLRRLYHRYGIKEAEEAEAPREPALAGR